MSWYLDTDNRLNHESLAEEISGDIITSPYPACFWNLTNNQLTLNDDYWQPMIDAIEGDILTPPYPASFWYYDEELGRLNMLLLPPDPIFPAIYAGKIKVKNIYIGEELVQAPYIGKIFLELDNASE
jgi:hypothetical protein